MSFRGCSGTAAGGRRSGQALQGQHSVMRQILTRSMGGQQREMASMCPAVSARTPPTTCSSLKILIIEGRTISKKHSRGGEEFLKGAQWEHCSGLGTWSSAVRSLLPLCARTSEAERSTKKQLSFLVNEGCESSILSFLGCHGLEEQLRDIVGSCRQNTADRCVAAKLVRD